MHQRVQSIQPFSVASNIDRHVQLAENPPCALKQDLVWTCTGPILFGLPAVVTLFDGLWSIGICSGDPFIWFRYHEHMLMVPIRLTEIISVHFFGMTEAGKREEASKSIEKSKSQMGMKRSNEPLLEVIPPRICVTFRRTSFWFRRKSSKMHIWKHPGRKHDKYRVTKPWQLLWKS